MRAESREPTGTSNDRCPYSRSFSAAYADNPSCAAYQAATFTVTDTANRALGSGITCRHLAVGADQRQRGRFYPRCRLGAADARLSWVAAVNHGRLAVARSLEEEFDELTRADRDALFAAKAQLPAGGEAEVVAREALELQLSRFLDGVDAYPAGLLLRGEIDVSNSDAIATAHRGRHHRAPAHEAGLTRASG